MTSTNNINLVDDRWIPVILKNGKFGYASLTEIFLKEAEIADISADTLERISLMRLFICIAETVLASSGDDNAFKNARECLEKHTANYLQKWKYKFNLFDEKYPFLQVANAEGETKPIAKLNFYEASGNSKIFINNKPCGEKLTSPQIALKLLVFQNFAPQGFYGQFKWNNNFTSKKANGPCENSICTAQNALHSFILKENIIDSILANVIEISEFKKGLRIDKQELGKPYWHFDLESKTEPEDAIKNDTQTFLGRLVPLCRAVKLSDSENIYLGNGLTYKSFPLYHEFTCTFIQKKK